MGRSKIKVGILTSSRADYGIYQPLLKVLAKDSSIDLHILVFGTHLSEKFGYTVKQIEADGYTISARIDTMPAGDSAQEISFAMGKTISAFSEIWAKQTYDLVFALGDRYEIFAAVGSALPFNIKIAHIHGGETTMGAIDNAFRHCISSMAQYHFTAAEPYRQKVIDITGSEKNVFNVGALSIDRIRQMTLLGVEEFKEKYQIDLSIPTILITFHPETVNFEINKTYVNELIDALKELSHYQKIITMPNADTMGLFIRERLNNYIAQSSNAIGIENFGADDYLSCMKHCSIMLGNTSSGFIEAAGLNKPVVNLGDRQKGRIETDNIFSTPVVKDKILQSVKEAEDYNLNNALTIYGEGKTAENIVEIVKTELLD